MIEWSCAHPWPARYGCPVGRLYELNIRHDAIDVYSAAVFMEAWRYVAPDTDEMAAISAVHDELSDIVDPFNGNADDVGVFAEGEPHDYGTVSIVQRH